MELQDQTKDKSLVLLLGSTHIEFGLAGDPKPLLDLPIIQYARPGHFHTRIEESHALDKDLSNKLIPKVNTIEADLQSFRFLFYPDWLVYEQADPIHSFEYNFKKYLIDIFLDLFARLGHDYVNAKIYILEDDPHNEKYKRIVIDVLLNVLQARAVLFVPSSLMVSLGAGVSDCLVVDGGWNWFHITPIYDGRILSNMCRFTNRAGRSLHYFLLDRNPSMSFNDIEKLTHGSDNSIIPYLLPDSSIWGKLEESSVSDLISTTLLNLPVDIQSSLASNIIFVGGLSKIEGFTDKVLHQVQATLQERSSKLHVSTSPSLGPWAGASIYCSTIIPGKSGIIQELRRD